MKNILEYYKEATRDNVILMLMRCKKLFDARVEVKKIAKLIMIQQELMKEIEPLFKKKSKTFNDEECGKIKQALKITQKLDSALNLFKDDHKMFRGRFLFGGKD